MAAADQEINFRAGASESRVSTAWLYGQKDLRETIMRSRRLQSQATLAASAPQDRERTSRQNILATLRLRIKTLETKNRELTELLKRASGVMAETRACTCREASEAPVAAKRPVLAWLGAGHEHQRDLREAGQRQRVMSSIRKARCGVIFLIGLLAVTMRVQGQRARGELRIEVRDPQGAALASTAELVSDGNQFRRNFQIAQDGRYVTQDLPFGVYRLSVKAEGFAPSTNVVKVRSEVPIHVAVTLGLAPVTTQVEVTDSVTLVDPNRTGTQYAIGSQVLAENIATQPGRDLSDLVAELPGWLYEANGVLHPRGSEYDVQYVVNGVPITENRSPAFAPSLDADDVESMRVLTANYPAEYGRKLGGIIEVTTEKDVPSGLHGRIDAGGGSFSTGSGSGAISYARGRNRFSLSADGFHTDRYLDPPVLENLTNTGNAGGFSGSYERELSDRDRVRITVSHNLTRFLVPNYLIQEDAGQRQNAADTETSGQVSFQHLISPNLLLSASGDVRDATAELSSNAFSTPVMVSQNRGYREGYVRADLAGHHGRQDWKLGSDSIFNPVHERLQYTLTDPTQFDLGTQQQFQFAYHRWDIEPSAYVQDQVHLDNWNVSGGLRFDHCAFVVHESAWSPRLGVSWYVHSLNLLIHASYDRVFQTPAIENLLLASSPQLDSLNPIVVRLPVRPARANYYEIGITKALVGKLRLDANVFRRDFRNYSDDDVLLDTGVSFPIAFTRARIIGEELRVEVPRWGRFSGYLSYTNQSGVGQGPITGGLFLGSDAANQLADTSKFAVSQDQRNTARVRVRFQARRRMWLALGSEYGSGLPADTGNADPAMLLAQYGAAILDRVNLERGRVRPSLSVDAAAGAELYRKEQRSVIFQLQTANLNNRVNCINFASLFSGTAIAPPRSISAHLRISF
jgi:outer membrane cobalamin receptor